MLLLADISSTIQSFLSSHTLLAIAACGLLYFLAFKFNVPGAASAANATLATLAPRLAKLTAFLPGLGLTLPSLSKLINDGGKGDFSSVVTDLHNVFDSLDDKGTRGNLLDSIFYAQLDRQLGDPDRKAALIAKLKAQGVL